jgi:(E)-4-hydroxy-3-methylbut-2-enyl-diphosphate synthase
MGCAVNGPGEAHDSQLGVTFGRGVGMIFKDGVPMRKVAGENIVDAFVMETEKLLAEIETRKATASIIEPELVQIS